MSDGMSDAKHYGPSLSKHGPPPVTPGDFSGDRLVGPHGGVLESMPSPTAEDLADPLFQAIWRVTKTWDVNSPEFYRGYCGMNGSHVMLILNEIRKVKVLS